MNGTSNTNKMNYGFKASIFLFDFVQSFCKSTFINLNFKHSKMGNKECCGCKEEVLNNNRVRKATIRP